MKKIHVLWYWIKLKTDFFNLAEIDFLLSQKDGCKYIGKLIVGGHSKGGNLSVYASMFCKDRVKNKIVEIINADGPGFDESIFNTENYIKILDKLNTYIPQSSIIGRLLEHDEDYEIIHSTQKGIMQHDIYSWQVNATNLVRIPNLTNDSQFVNKVVREWLQNTTPEQRENYPTSGRLYRAFNGTIELVIPKGASKDSKGLWKL